PRLERHAPGNRPGGERAVALESKVVVEPSRVVALDDKDRRSGAAATAGEGLGRRPRPALAAVLAKIGHTGSLPRGAGDKPVDDVDSAPAAAHKNLAKS